MPLTFPTGVADGYVHTDGDRSWKYNDTYNAWEELSQPTAHKSTHATGGSDALTPAAIGAEPAKGADDNYVTDAEKTVIGNTSGTNTGDETPARIATALNAGTEDTTAADTDRLAVTHPAGGWMLLSTLWTWITTKLGALTSITAGGAWSFSSATRPTSAATTGTLAAANAGSLITKGDGDARFGGSVQRAYKTASTSRNTTTTVTDDPHLTLYLETGTYIFTGRLSWHGITGSTYGFKCATNFTGTIGNKLGITGRGSTNGSPSIFSHPDNFGSTYSQLAADQTSAAGYVYCEGYMTVTVAGTISVQWAQSASNASNTTLGQYSWIEAKKIA
jgi:hypothetical protein